VKTSPGGDKKRIQKFYEEVSQNGKLKEKGLKNNNTGMTGGRFHFVISLSICSSLAEFYNNEMLPTLTDKTYLSNLHRLGFTEFLIRKNNRLFTKVSGNEPSGSIKCRETTEWLHNLWPLERYSAPQN
jgi:hypothetical protein